MREKHAAKTGYPSDVSDEEWAFVALTSTLMMEDTPQRVYLLREVFNSLRYIVRAGCPWHMLPNDLPSWELVYQQTQRWLKEGVFEPIVHDLRTLLRLAKGHDADSRGAIFDSRTPKARPKAGAEQATTATRGAREPRCTWQSIRWATCWCYTSHRPTPRTAAK